MMWTGWAELTGVWLIVGACFVPIAFFVGHLNVTREISEADKAVWRRFLWYPGWDFWSAICRYLMATSLPGATHRRQAERNAQ